MALILAPVGSVGVVLLSPFGSVALLIVSVAMLSAAWSWRSRSQSLALVPPRVFIAAVGGCLVTFVGGYGVLFGLLWALRAPATASDVMTPRISTQTPRF